MGRECCGGTWGCPSGVSKETTAPALEPVRYCPKLELCVREWEWQCPQGLGGSNTMQSPKCPLSDVSPGAWRAGPGKETPVPLPAQLGLERTQGPLQLLGVRSSSHPVPLLRPPPPDKRRKGWKIQYLPPPAQAWPLQRKRRAVTQENPRGGPTTHQLPWWQGDYEQRGACRRTGSLSPAKGTSRRQRVTPRSRKAFISLRRIPSDGLTAAGVIQRVRPPTRQCPSVFPPPP